MPNSWADCPQSTRDQVARLVHILKGILGARLVGVYLHGSLALGCFNPFRSDIDLLVVSADAMSADEKKSLASHLLAISLNPTPIELSLTSLAQIQSTQHPLICEMHYSEDWRQRFQEPSQLNAFVTMEPPLADHDLSAHIAVLLERGLTLIGPDVSQVFPPVDKAHVIDSLVRDFEYGRNRIEQNPEYFILNSCRLHAFLLDGKMLSKSEGADWALSRYQLKYCALVGIAKRCYTNELPEASFNIPTGPQLENFLTYMESELSQLLPNYALRGSVNR